MINRECFFVGKLVRLSSLDCSVRCVPKLPIRVILQDHLFLIITMLVLLCALGTCTPSNWRQMKVTDRRKLLILILPFIESILGVWWRVKVDAFDPCFMEAKDISVSV